MRYYAVCTMSIVRHHNDTSQLTLFNSSSIRKLVITETIIFNFPLYIVAICLVVFIKYLS